MRWPILIVNGRADDNSPVSVIEVYVKKLRAAGKQVEAYLPDNGPPTRRAVEFLQSRFQMAP